MITKAAQTSIFERIKDTTAQTHAPVTLGTALYHDLRIWGEDFYELIDWISVTFGTDFSKMDMSKYAPGEGPGELGIVRLFTGKSPYRTCTVSQLLTAVECGSWRD